MRKLLLLAGVAALSASIPALAQNQGHGKGRGGGQGAQHADHRGGGGQGHAERGRGRDDHSQASRGRGRGGNDQAQRGQGRGRDEVREVRVDNRGRGRGRDDNVRVVRDDRRGDRVVVVDRFDDDIVRIRGERGRRLAVGSAGCPPGLAKKNAFCMPPGQLRHSAQLVGQRLPLFNLGYNVPDRYRYRFLDDDRFLYRYGNDGVVYRFDRGSGLVNSIFPLYSTGLFPGEPMPLGYDVYNVPFAYRGYYPDSSDYFYRYDNGGIYRVNSNSLMVESIVALLAGGGMGGLGGLGVGDPLPLGYDAYNVPFAYRDRYYDGDHMYRYADGYIYQVDPETRLIQAVISMLV